MAESIRRDGCLQPIRVRATEHGDYVLIAGERRYRAAVKAAVMELPAIIRPAGAGDEEEHGDLLVEALIENELRRNLDPVACARGYQRLVDSGLTVKGVAERLHTSQARVREHLRILKLPEDLQQKIAADDLPLRAVKPLAKLESIHPGLAAVAAEEVLKPRDAYEACSWADVERAPLEVALSGAALPDGIYRAHSPYPLTAFSLGDGAKKDLAALERILGRPLGEIRFDATDLEQARSPGAAHGEGWQSIIVGGDIAERGAGGSRTDDSGGAVQGDAGDPSADGGSGRSWSSAARRWRSGRSRAAPGGAGAPRQSRCLASGRGAGRRRAVELARRAGVRAGAPVWDRFGSFAGQPFIRGEVMGGRESHGCDRQSSAGAAIGRLRRSSRDGSRTMLGWRRRSPAVRARDSKQRSNLVPGRVEERLNDGPDLQIHHAGGGSLQLVDQIRRMAAEVRQRRQNPWSGREAPARLLHRGQRRLGARKRPGA